jgi:hypothetical protein
MFAPSPKNPTEPTFYLAFDTKDGVGRLVCRNPVKTSAAHPVAFFRTTVCTLKVHELYSYGISVVQKE